MKTQLLDYGSDDRYKKAWKSCIAVCKKLQQMQREHRIFIHQIDGYISEIRYITFKEDCVVAEIG